MGLGPFPEDATPNPSLQDQAKHHIVNLRSQPPFSSQNGGGDNPVGDRSNAQMTFSPGLPSRSPRRRTGIMSPPYQLPRLVSSPPLNSEVSSTQEPNLSDFQHERQLYEKTRLENESLGRNFLPKLVRSPLIW
uniref:ARM repeat superfamily protein n=1 Tax=Mesocestoides corti TaxID=53468 RepID=A0A5K3FW83_MESCO